MFIDVFNDSGPAAGIQAVFNSALTKSIFVTPELFDLISKDFERILNDNNVAETVKNGYRVGLSAFTVLYLATKYPIRIIFQDVVKD